MKDVFYCAESVLLSEYRGQGAGHAFFDRREAHAARLGFARSPSAVSCDRADHPDRPEGYRPLDAFWRARGYAPLPVSSPISAGAISATRSRRRSRCNSG
jgi:GNAT superfamily N-acetyltransferase